MYKILILTDSNRKFLEVVCTNNLSGLLQDMAVVRDTQIGASTPLSRIVYEETFASEALAQARLLALNNSARMLRERIIRRQNPNWLSLYPIKSGITLYQPAQYIH